ncbi:hypothetical protein D3C71_1042880 [compost metagenome]
MLSFIPRIAPGGLPPSADWMDATPILSSQDSLVAPTEYLRSGTAFFTAPPTFTLSPLTLPAEFETDYIPMRRPAFTLSALTLPETYEASA